MAEDESIARKLRIEGRVQGVGYRAWTVGNARELGLDGWVRNREDGTVEALFKGPQEKVSAMIERCSEGPPAAKVHNIRQEEARGITEEGFHTKPTV